MEYLTPNFTKDMLKDYTLLIPNMCPVHFTLVKAAMESEGYHKVEFLDNCGSEVSQLGLRYVHNDTCYPALLIIGQFLDALNSGKYDAHHTALLITQSGGGCRASNYIKLLRKALVRAGYEYVPVASANVSGLEPGSVPPFTYRMLMKILAAIEYGDALVALRNQTQAYEITKGDSDALQQYWLDKISVWIRSNKNYLIPAIRHNFTALAKSFAAIPMKKEPKVKVGVVGEIYVKFSPLGNNDLIHFLESQDCEVNLPSLMGYAEYCCANWMLDYEYYGLDKKMGKYAKTALKLLDSLSMSMNRALKKNGFYAPDSFFELMKKPDGILGLGTKMGEGWLLTGEMVELIEGGYANIVCAQPFGCLPNHIAGKGVINRIRAMHPEANITPVDYDPSATRVNQENRIKLMLAVAKENLNSKAKTSI
ncbi:MAG: 2-hydroxyglutaryl-CoA dehydratase [Erysipelotrichia bacterium]|nr:2-hydroxyglutaryl-CoA dehydratase [Erysipelotrichia bacterium]